MRAVDRAMVAVPPSLGPEGSGPRELIRARDHRSGTAAGRKAFEHRAYKEPDVKLALETLFHGKCAYCETRYSASAPVDVEHHRPKGAVAEAARHGGYWWIAMDWENLLPSCIDCNRQRNQVIVEVSSSLVEMTLESARVPAGKKDSFPIVDEEDRAQAETLDFAAEGAILIDPCRDDPAECLAYNFDPVHPLGVIVPNGAGDCAVRGAVSIQVYGLNRLHLVQDRTEVLRRLEFLGTLVIDLAKSIEELEDSDVVQRLSGTPAAKVAARLRLLRDRTLQEMKAMASDEAPYTSMTRAWLAEFKSRIGD